jgi:hypothetical protein
LAGAVILQLPCHCLSIPAMVRPQNYLKHNMMYIQKENSPEFFLGYKLKNVYYIYRYLQLHQLYLPKGDQFLQIFFIKNSSSKKKADKF